MFSTVLVGTPASVSSSYSSSFVRLAWKYFTTPVEDATLKITEDCHHYRLAHQPAVQCVSWKMCASLPEEGVVVEVRDAGPLPFREAATILESVAHVRHSARPARRKCGRGDPVMWRIKGPVPDATSTCRINDERPGPQTPTLGPVSCTLHVGYYQGRGSLPTDIRFNYVKPKYCALFET